MAQHDYSLANQSGSAFRSDLNNALAAIVSQNSGSAEPITRYAYQYWIDTSTTPALIKQRNAANSGWITLGEVDGQTLAVDGTVAKPGISFAADIDTGLRRNAADDISIVTGGTQAITVDNAQKVGIGTSNPVTYLTVGATASGEEGKSLCIQNTGSGLNTSVALYLTPNNGGGNDLVRTAAIKSRQDQAGNYANLEFYTSASATPAERMTITSDGNVGINNAGPVSPLDILTANGRMLVREDHSDICLDSVNTANSAFDNFRIRGYDILFQYGSTERMRLAGPSGNLGIGTSSPIAQVTALAVNSSGEGGTMCIQNTGSGLNTSVALYLTPNNGGGNDLVRTAAIKSRQDQAGNYANLEFYTSASAAPANRMTITSSGNVGIGTSSPSAKLTVNGSLSKSSGSFRIDHPLPALAETHHLVHSFVEAPDASNLYAGMVDLVDGRATINIDTAHRMTEGTFEALNTIQSWSSSNESGYAPVKCSISGNLLTIECQDVTSTDTVYYEVRGVRKDQHMLDTEWTDENGRVITEPSKPAEPNDKIETLEAEIAALEAVN